jgi:tungstate transport system substrate-binding protein
MLRRSARGNVEYGMAVRGVRRWSAAFARSRRSSACGLASLADRQARVLSGGEQQRLALARALGHAPACCSSTSPPRASILGRRRGRARHGGDPRCGTAIVFSTHVLGLARRLADEIVFLHQGRIVERTPAAQFFTHSQTAEAVISSGESSMERNYRSTAGRLMRWTVGGIAAAALGLAAVQLASAEEPSPWHRRPPPSSRDSSSTCFRKIRKATNIDVRVVAVGTGQALDMARRGDADIVFVHDPAAEEKFVAEGFGVRRFSVMYNDFVIVGPRSDPAKAKGNDVVAALKRISEAQAPFASRADKSGTHAAELRYWKAAGIEPKGAWYRETGSGMGPTLNTAAGMNAYALADRGTWLSFKNRADLVILVEGDVRLFNQYGVMLVNPAKHPHVKKDPAQKVLDYLISPAGQAAIAGYKINGEQLFFPNYTPGS